MNKNQLITRLKKHKLLISIFIAGLGLRMYAALLDPFLHDWDERFHALVARNMIYHPLIPMLRAHPITNHFDPNLWCCNHIWLHKPPLFLWQMALSMKLFGASLFAMRLPSVIMGSIMILLLYRITLIFTNENKRTAVIAALLLATSNFQLQMTSGIIGMDHNDLAFGFYVLASIWVYAEYVQNQTLVSAILIGIFAGCAVLNKWLVGLLVYLGWGINLLLSLKQDSFRKEIKHFIISCLACLIIFIPWQIYIYHSFPDLARFESDFNWRHITEALEGHSGTWRYYLDHFTSIFGMHGYFLIPLGIVFLFNNILFNQKLKGAVLIGSIFVFCFYSFIVKTKVDAHFFFVAPLFMIFIAVAIDKLLELSFINNYRLILFSFIAYLSLNPLQMIQYIAPSNKVRNDRIFNTYIYQNLHKYIPADTKVMINMNAFEDIDVMFYNNEMTAYHFTLSEEDTEEIKLKKTPIYAFKPHGKYKLPEWIECYPYLHIINFELRTSKL